MKYFISK